MLNDDEWIIDMWDDARLQAADDMRIGVSLPMAQALRQEFFPD